MTTIHRPRASKKPKQRSAAYNHATAPYRARSYAAGVIEHTITQRLVPVPGADNLYAYNYAGISGKLRVRRDGDVNGRVLFVVYVKGSSSRGCYFLTAPNVWAHLHGYPKVLLAPEDYPRWRVALEQAAGAEDDLRGPAQFEDLPDLPDPNTDPAGWKPFEAVLGRRLYPNRRRTMFCVWTFFVRRWTASAAATRSRWPAAIKAAVDGFLSKHLNADPDTIARAIADLHRLGYLQAANCERRFYDAPDGSKAMRRGGVYAYLPGTGVPVPEAKKIGCGDWQSLPTGPVLVDTEVIRQYADRMRRFKTAQRAQAQEAAETQAKRAREWREAVAESERREAERVAAHAAARVVRVTLVPSGPAEIPQAEDGTPDPDADLLQGLRDQSDREEIA